MHEISLVKNIFGSLDSIYAEDERKKIKNIYLKVGKLSNVEPILMQNAFEAVVATEWKAYANSKLLIEVLPILIYCEACDKENEVKNYRFVCACDKPSKNITQGNELMISGVEFHE